MSFNRHSPVIAAFLGFFAALTAATSPAYAQVDVTAPTVAITTPAVNGIIASLSSVTGTAVDYGTGGGAAVGVRSVSFSIVRDWTDTRTCWNPVTSTWQTGVFYVQAVVNPSTPAANATWSLGSGIPTGANLPQGKYTINVKATDANNLTGAAVGEVIYIGPSDTTPPTVTTSFTTAKDFAGGGTVYYAYVPKSLPLLPQTLIGVGESEFLMRYLATGFSPTSVPIVP